MVRPVSHQHQADVEPSGWALVMVRPVSHQHQADVKPSGRALGATLCSGDRTSSAGLVL